MMLDFIRDTIVIHQSMITSPAWRRRHPVPAPIAASDPEDTPRDAVR
jgi:hypothetical protein